MSDDIKLNQLVEWTAEDRAKGVCPVPTWSVVTLWFEDATCLKVSDPKLWDWSGSPTLDDEIITAYLVHSVPREPIVRHLFIDEFGFEFLFSEKSVADDLAKENGGRVVKMVEEMD